MSGSGRGFSIERAASGAAGVSSVAKNGDTQLTGDITLSEGANVTLTQVGNDIEIAATGAAGAPSDADYLVGTANGGLSNEIVVGTTPGGELGGTWASPTVDATHSGSAHHAESHALNAAAHTGTLDDGQIPAGITRDSEINAIDFLVGTATGFLSGEIVAGTAPGGELGGTWASPTVDATHSGSAHHGQSHAINSADHTGTLDDAQIPAAITRDSEWNGIDFLVGTATGSLSGEIVAGTAPGGELGGTWASPTVDATHSGSAHADFTLLTTFNDHSARHESAGADAVKLDDLAAPDDNTDLNASTTAHGLMPKGTGSTATFYRSDMTQAAPTASVSISEVDIAFTDGDTLRRVTVTDAGVTAASKIVGSIRRPDTTDDSADRGYIYLPNIVRVGSGAFDLLVSCLGWGFDDPTPNPPNETIKFYYTFA